MSILLYNNGRLKDYSLHDASTLQLLNSRDITIANGAILGDCITIEYGVKIGKGANIADGVYLSMGCVIGENALINESVKICEDVIVGNNAVVGAHAILGKNITIIPNGIVPENLHVTNNNIDVVIAGDINKNKKQSSEEKSEGMKRPDEMLEDAVRPLMKLLAENYNEDTSVIVSNRTVKLIRENMFLATKVYLSKKTNK